MYCLKCGFDNQGKTWNCVRCGTPLPPDIPDVTETVTASPMLTFILNIHDEVRKKDYDQDKAAEGLIKVLDHMESVCDVHLEGEEAVQGKPLLEDEFYSTLETMETYMEAIERMLSHVEGETPYEVFRQALRDAEAADRAMSESSRDDSYRTINVFSMQSSVEFNTAKNPAEGFQV